MAKLLRGRAPGVRGRGGTAAGLVGLWGLRVVWVVLPLGLGPGVGPAIDRVGGGGALLLEGCLWAAWFAGLVAAAVPSPAGLTAVRILAPLTVPVAGVAAIGPTGSVNTAALALAHGLLATGVAFSPVVGDRMVNGSAYGSERRMALRPPAFVLAGPVQLLWGAMAATAIGGPLLLATDHVIAGTVVSVAAVGLWWLGWRVLHQLSRRWLVFVPAGFVIHDHLLTVEAILLRRTTVAALGPAPAAVPEPVDGPVQPVVDLSGGAYGLSLEAVLETTVRFGRRRGRNINEIETSRIIFTPTLPGAVLAEARTRAIAIGTLTA
ncbi:MAG: hypothetical protein ACFCVK_06045 [Acidimicrobiales bacterium]